jgi:glycosidase
MPDLNQANPFVQNYIIQNTIWWVEYAGIDGIREDTYPYNNQKFMAEWAKEVINEFPTLNIVGEVWTGEPAFLAGYQKDTFLPRGFNSNLPAITDFALRDKLIGYLQGQSSLYDIFNVFAKDYLYKDSNQLVTFADNHDLARVMFFANGNVDKAKIIYTILLTTRGIPSVLYGSEIGMIGSNDHGALRMPFPGGFPNDTRNAFTETGRSDKENDIFNFLKELIQLRKEYRALATGKLTHFPPVNDVYVYFKTNKNEKMMVVVNNNPKQVSVDLSGMKKFINNGSKLENIKTKSTLELEGKLELNIDGLKAGIYRIF